MTPRGRHILAFVLAVTAITIALIGWSSLLGGRRPKADARIAYGPDPRQHADLWLPAGKAKGVVVLVHGGCWRSSSDAAEGLNAVAEDLRRRRFAVWNIEYRGINQAPFPATFQDVSRGADALGAAAERHGIDLRHVIVVGHSAGGHLALWLAARAAIAPSSPLHDTAPLKLTAAISLGGPPDLEANRRALPGCGPDAVPQLVGEPSPQRTDVYADTSPARLLQPAIPVVLISGGGDIVVPPTLAQAYTERVRGNVRHIIIPDARHLDLIAPSTNAWNQAVAAIEAAAG